MKYLIYHTGALGDFITSLPVFKLLKSLDSHNGITLLGKQSFGKLGRQAGLIDRVLDIDRAQFSPLFKELPTAQDLDLVEIDLPDSHAVQPYAVSRGSQHKWLLERFFAAVRSEESQENFRAHGFRWRDDS